jgi:hypothetical protein
VEYLKLVNKLYIAKLLSSASPFVMLVD